MFVTLRAAGFWSKSRTFQRKEHGELALETSNGSYIGSVYTCTKHTLSNIDLDIINQ